MFKSLAWTIASGFFLLLAIWYVHAERSNKIFNGDSAGYYAYLPAFISGQDYQFEALKKQEQEAKVYSNYRIQKNQHILNKYPVGVAICSLPFYLIGVLFGSGPFGEIMQMCLLLGSVFYVATAAWCFDKLSAKLRLNRILAAGLFISTNLTYYVIAEPLMSHVYSFSLFCICLYLLHQFLESDRSPFLILISILLGLLIVIRPVNALGILFLPFVLRIYGYDLRSLSEKISKQYVHLFWAFIPVMILCLVWYLQTGRLFVWSYAHEGFNWLQPHIWEVWFSFKKGLFIYAPVLLLMIAAIILTVKKDRQTGLLFFVPYLILSYVISCWWSWYYGDSFGHRAFIEFYPFFFLIILYALKQFYQRAILTALVLPFFALSLVQSWQYEKGIIHPNSMSWQKYAHIFMKTGDDYVGCLGNEQEAPPYRTDQNLIKESSWKHIMSESNEYLMSSEIQSDHKLFIVLDAEKFSEQVINYKGTLLTAQGLDSAGSTEYLKTIPYYNINTESYQKWVHLHTEWVLPHAHTVRIYIWNQQKLDFQLRNCHLKTYELVSK